MLQVVAFLAKYFIGLNFLLLIFIAVVYALKLIDSPKADDKRTVFYLWLIALALIIGMFSYYAKVMMGLSWWQIIGGFLAAIAIAWAIFALWIKRFVDKIIALINYELRAGQMYNVNGNFAHFLGFRKNWALFKLIDNNQLLQVPLNHIVEQQATISGNFDKYWLYLPEDLLKEQFDLQQIGELVNQLQIVDPKQVAIVMEDDSQGQSKVKLCFEASVPLEKALHLKQQLIERLKLAES